LKVRETAERGKREVVISNIKNGLISMMCDASYQSRTSERKRKRRRRRRKRRKRKKKKRRKRNRDRESDTVIDV